MALNAVETQKKGIGLFNKKKGKHSFGAADGAPSDVFASPQATEDSSFAQSDYSGNDGAAAEADGSSDALLDDLLAPAVPETASATVSGDDARGLASDNEDGKRDAPAAWNIPSVSPADDANRPYAVSESDAAGTAPAMVQPIPAVAQAVPGVQMGAAADPFASLHETKERKAGKRVALAFGILALVLVAIYAAGLVYFSDHIFPHTTMGDSDISLMSTAELESHLQEKTSDYALQVNGPSFSLTIPGTQIDFVFDHAAVAKGVRSEQNPFAWPLECTRSHDFTHAVVADFNEPALKVIVRYAVEEHNKTATDPVDATLSYDEKKDAVVVVPEEYGTKIDADAACESAAVAVGMVARTLTLTEDQLVQPNVKSTDEKLTKAAANCNNLTHANMKFTFNGDVVLQAGLYCIGEWVDIAADGTVTLNEDKIDEWIEKNTASFTTTSGTRTYTRANDGKEITVSGGDYGWEVDGEAFREMIETGLAENSTATMEMPYTQTAQMVVEDGVRDWGNRYIDVDLSEQHAYFFDENNNVIWESDIVSGNVNIADRATPEGVWDINDMKQNVTLRTYEGGEDTEPSLTLVYYWMPFVGNTIGLHDAWWQPGFGGTMYRDGYGSHGCINLPSDAAAELYELAHVGDVVVTHW